MEEETIEGYFIEVKEIYPYIKNLEIHDGTDLKELKSLFERIKKMREIAEKYPKKIFFPSEVYRILEEILNKCEKIKMEVPFIMKLEKLNGNITVKSLSIYYTSRNTSTRAGIDLEELKKILGPNKNLVFAHNHLGGYGTIIQRSIDGRKIVFFNFYDIEVSKILDVELWTFYKEKNKIVLDIILADSHYSLE